MKTTSKILLAALAAVIIIMAAVLITIRVKAAQSVEFGTLTKTEREMIKENVQIDGFTGIETKGAWKLIIAQGTEYEVTAEYPKYIRDNVEITLEGKTLSCILTPGTSLNLGAAKLELTVITPRLQEVRTEGGSQVILNDVNVPSLRLASRGASSFKGNSSVIENLYIDTEGASDVDMSESSITNAEVNMKGAGSAQLNMNGGVLSGRVEGATSVEYSGTISEQNIRSSGISSINRK